MGMFDKMKEGAKNLTGGAVDKAKQELKGKIIGDATGSVVDALLKQVPASFAESAAGPVEEQITDWVTEKATDLVQSKVSELTKGKLDDFTEPIIEEVMSKVIEIAVEKIKGKLGIG